MTVRAAGGVVWRRAERRAERDRVEIVVVHRPRYDDWSLPKGKAEPEETDEDCALREVEEETSLRCRLGPELRSVSYTDNRGRPKTVRFWSMVPVRGDLAPQNEVDEAIWVRAEEARDLLTYRRELDVLDDFLGHLR